MSKSAQSCAKASKMSSLARSVPKPLFLVTSLARSVPKPLFFVTSLARSVPKPLFLQLSNSGKKEKSK